jgi:hypothetical protein
MSSTTTVTLRSPRAPFALLAALAGAVSAYQPLRAVEAAPADAGEAAPSAAPPASSAAPGDGGKALPVSAYAWPTDLAPEPREEDWAAATELLSDPPDAPCKQQALGAWLRITCGPDGTVRYGALWALAGDASKVKAKFMLSYEIEHFDKPPSSEGDDLMRKAGATAIVTLPLAPGSAVLLRLDTIFWDDEYSFSGLISRAGPLLDVSWAAGEKHPTILYR